MSLSSTPKKWIKLSLKHWYSSSRRKGLLVFKTLWRHLKHVFSVRIFCLPRHFHALQRRLKDILKMTWNNKKGYTKDVSKTSWRLSSNNLKTCLEDMSWRRLENMSYGHLHNVLETKNKCLLKISMSKKSKCISNKSIFHKSISDNSKANPKCIS